MSAEEPRVIDAWLLAEGRLEFPDVPPAIVMPTLRGWPLQKAIRDMGALGMGYVPEARVEWEPTGQIPSGYVLSTDPPAGETLERGSFITYTVSGGRVCDMLQGVIDGTRDHANRVVLPPGDWTLEEPLRITKLRTKMVRDGVTLHYAGGDPIVFDGGSVFWHDEATKEPQTDDDGRPIPGLFSLVWSPEHFSLTD